MNNEPLDVDRIVREIVSRLRAELKTQPAETLTLDVRVVTLAALEGRLEGVRKLIVGARAIVTPSARDDLTDKNIEIVRSPNE